MEKKLSKVELDTITPLVVKNCQKKLKEAIPKMSEFDKGYILGKVESFSDNNLEQKTDKKETVDLDQKGD